MQLEKRNKLVKIALKIWNKWFFSLLNEKKSTLFRLTKPQRKLGILKSKM